MYNTRSPSEDRTITRGLTLPPPSVWLFCAVSLLGFLFLKWWSRLPPDPRQTARHVRQEPEIFRDRELLPPRAKRSQYYLERKTTWY